MTIQPGTTDKSVRLLVDRPAPSSFPEADLIVTNIRIRTLHLSQASLVTIVQQRMPVFDVELEPIAGITVGQELHVFGGAMGSSVDIPRQCRCWICYR